MHRLIASEVIGLESKKEIFRNIKILNATQQLIIISVSKIEILLKEGKDHRAFQLACSNINFLYHFFFAMKISIFGIGSSSKMDCRRAYYYLLSTVCFE